MILNLQTAQITNLCDAVNTKSFNLELAIRRTCHLDNSKSLRCDFTTPDLAILGTHIHIWQLVFL